MAGLRGPAFCSQYWQLEMIFREPNSPLQRGRGQP